MCRQSASCTDKRLTITFNSYLSSYDRPTILHATNTNTLSSVNNKTGTRQHKYDYDRDVQINARWIDNTAGGATSVKLLSNGDLCTLNSAGTVWCANTGDNNCPGGLGGGSVQIVNDKLTIFNRLGQRIFYAPAGSLTNYATTCCTDKNKDYCVESLAY